MSSASQGESDDTPIYFIATLSRPTYDDVEISMTSSGSVSGTATLNTDFGSFNGDPVSIAAGSTSGSKGGVLIDDSLAEGNETIIVEISSVSGGGATESGDQRQTFTIIDDDNNLNGGTAATFSSTLASAYETNSETLAIEALNPNKNSEPSPYQTINLPEAYGYNKGGSGQTIAIMDMGFYVDEAGFSEHVELDGKTIATYGSFYSPSTSNYHGTSVASVAAGDIGDNGMHGVAPFASLHLSDYGYKGSTTYYPDHLADATEDAKNSGAVVQNNSWGYEYQIDEIQSDMQSTGNTAANQVAIEWTSQGYTASTSSVTNYINALDDFQSTGVVVYALSNDDTFTDADFQAALPELFPELSEAWITAVNIETDGSNYDVKSAPCGQTAEYCLGGDGWNITTAAYVVGGDSYYSNTAGTSFVAPQISGAVALLAEHFPNHTPEQLVDRLLASADNTSMIDDLGGHDGYVTFSNGQTHGYSELYGHGLMDIYAALQPITSSSYTARVYAGSSSINGGYYSLARTVVSSSRSFGDGLISSLSNENVYFYDDFNGGFSANASSMVNTVATSVPTLSLKDGLSLLGREIENDQVPTLSPLVSSILSSESGSDDQEILLTLNSGNASTQSLLTGSVDAFSSLTSYDLPYLDVNEQGIGYTYVEKGENSRFTISASHPIKADEEIEYGDKSIFAASYEFAGDVESITFSGGKSLQKDSLLGLTGSGAFTTEGGDSETSFIGARFGYKLSDDVEVNYRHTIASTNFNGASDSMLKSASGIKSDAFSFDLGINNIKGDDKFTMFISQPNRVSEGSVSMSIANLADENGNISYRNVDLGLAPSGRQLDLGISYESEIFDDATVAMQLVHSKEPNHVKNAKSVTSSFIGIGNKELKLGLTNDNSLDRSDIRIEWAKRF
jgi:hypothetical protein